MFTVEEIEKKQNQIKQINLIMNGNPHKTIPFQYKYYPTIQQIQKFIQTKWNTKYKTMKIFNVEGLEYYQEDLRYLKTNQILYISRGQQFDANSSFGQYEIIQKLGQGGFGKVCLGKHKNTGQLVAIKIMKANRIENAHDIDLIFRQSEYLKSLNHTNIVKLYNCYTIKEMQVIVIMEYMQGGQLLQKLKSQEKFTQEDAKIYFKQIVNAVSYCHSKNIIHRDLKLQNILLKKNNLTQIKVADFGISGVATHFNPDVDSGTLKYMSPEVLSGKEKGNSPMIDIWALGCILYYMVIGKLPFVGATINQNIKLIIQGNLKFPKDIILSNQVISLIKKMLDINPKTRIKMSDIEEDVWLNTRKKDFFIEKKQQIQKTIQLLNQNIPEKGIKKRQSEKKKMMIGKGKLTSIIQIPKRLQKQKDLIQNQLKQYQKNRQRNSNLKRISIKSQNKNKNLNMNLKSLQLVGVFKQKSIFPNSVISQTKTKEPSPKRNKKFI